MAAAGADPSTHTPFVVPRRPRSMRSWKLATVVLGLALAVMLTLLALAVADQGPQGAPSPARAVGPAAAPGPTASGGSKGSAAAQAAAVDALLASSASLHAQVVDAIDAVDTCAAPAAAAATLAGAANARQRLVNRLPGINWRVLPGGAALGGELTAALDDSVHSDRDYAAWGRDVAGVGCAPGQPAQDDAAYRAAQDADTAASAAKSRFAGDWSAVAGAFGLPARSATSI